MLGRYWETPNVSIRLVISNTLKRPVEKSIKWGYLQIIKNSFIHNLIDSLRQLMLIKPIKNSRIASNMKRKDPSKIMRAIKI